MSSKYILNPAVSILLGIFIIPSLSSPISVPTELLDALIDKRDVPWALPQKASDKEIRFQPRLDFDKDGCYNTPAIGKDGDLATGMGHDNTGGADGCRDEADLDNNNVYVRTRCNNNWCAYMYDYYFEKDVAVQHVADVGGHRHDWEHIAVFVEGNDETPKVVAVSAHGEYTTKWFKDIHPEGQSHAKVVYHKDGGSTHAFRFAEAKDNAVENHKGIWFQGALVSYNGGFPSNEIRDKMLNNDWGEHPAPAIREASFSEQLSKARDNGQGARGEDMVPRFNVAYDE
jgi:hypothetical protein